MKKFSKRLKELREEHNHSWNSLSKKIGYTRVAVGRWEKGEQIPSIEALEKLVKLFNCSADYLIGLTDNY